MGLRKNKTLLDQAEEVVETALDQAKHFAQETAIPALVEARERAAEAGEKAMEKATPVVSAGAAKVVEKATEAKEYADARAAAVTGQEPQKRSKLKLLLLFGGVAAAVAFVAKKLQGGGNQSNWQSSYTPAPPPGEDVTLAEDPTDVASGGTDPLSDPLRGTGPAEPPTTLADEATASAPPVEEDAENKQ